MSITATELYRKHRPTTFKAVIGQQRAVSMLKEMVTNDRVPHALLFVGGSGCGKTTLARIIKEKMECSDNDFVEVNCADFRGIDMVREIRNRMGLSPIGGKCRMWLIDECHQLSKDAQNALLKMLEDTPAHVYFMLATTDPQKLLTTIRTRCTEVKLVELKAADMTALLQTTAEKEGKTLSEEVLARLVEYACGSARKALVLLNQVINIEGDEAQLDAIASSDSKTKAIELARALLQKAPWAEVAAILKDLDEEPESLRRMVLSYASNVLLGGGKAAPRAFLLCDVFQHHFYDSGKPGLVTACYAVCSR